MADAKEDVYDAFEQVAKCSHSQGVLLMVVQERAGALDAN